MVKSLLKVPVVLLLIGGIGVAQSEGEIDTVADTSAVAPTDTAVTQEPVETFLAATIDDSIRIAFPRVEPDTLTEAQRLLVEFETRYLLRRQETAGVEIADEFSYFDSLVTYYLSPGWNLREDIDRSFYHDAGDYFRSDPRHFVLEPQVTPTRKTVQPYGLSGNRLGLLTGGKPSHPFEHSLEPDGLIDLNDVPTALDHTVAVLPGPIGMLFGGDHAVATLLTVPKKNDSNDPESCFLVDKGSFAFSHARGRYSRDFSDGRRVDMSIAYRSADGLVFGRGDDAYHYTGTVHFPLGPNRAVRFDGSLYDRSGPYPIRPEFGGRAPGRDRFDRSAGLLYLSHNDDHSRKNEVGYTYLRQGSYWSDDYRAALNQTGHAVHLAREWLWGGTVVRSSVRADHLEFDNWHEKHERASATARLSLARLSRPVGVAFDFRQRYVEGYRWLPAAAAMVRRETESFYVMMSGGYSERAPSLYELNLPYQEQSIYNTAVTDYADGGNAGLISEKQLVGSLEIAAGTLRNRLGLTVTGGRTWDGIDWLRRSEGGSETYLPSNGDIDWATVASEARLELSDWLRFKGGGAYHHIDYENFDDRPYTPEYQVFSGLELHVFWSQKLIDLWAYGEVVYAGPYDGFIQANLGGEPVANLKLSFKMGSFRFHWISQNALSLVINPRDGWVNPGYYTSYGFTWDFHD